MFIDHHHMLLLLCDACTQCSPLVSQPFAWVRPSRQRIHSPEDVYFTCFILLSKSPITHGSAGLISPALLFSLGHPFSYDLCYLYFSLGHWRSSTSFLFLHLFSFVCSKKKNEKEFLRLYIPTFFSNNKLIISCQFVLKSKISYYRYI